MSDVPTNGANNMHTSSQGLKQNTGVHSRDIEDIDRELEAYLEEKRSGKSVGYHHSVDEQLSQIREKFGARVTPTKESEKPKEVDVVKSSLNSPTSHTEENPAKQDVSDKVRSGSQSAPVLSHDELIRSLEEKYSRGESTNVPPKTPASPQVDAQPQKESVSAAPKQELSPALADLKENMAPLNQSRVDSILLKAAQSTAEEQRSLLDAFLPRFKRNMERKELYTKTQNELEDELERFVSNAGTARKPEEVGSMKAEESVKPLAEERSSEQGSEPLTQKTEIVEPATPPLTKEVAPPTEGASSIERRYRSYLARLEKKPLVLVYEPENGFVRKPVDPDDSTLTLTYSLDSSTNTALLTVYDERGNELGVFRTPEKELDN